MPNGLCWIPSSQNHFAARTDEGAPGRTAVGMPFFGCFVLVLLGLTCLTGIPPIRPAIADL